MYSSRYVHGKENETITMEIFDYIDAALYDEDDELIKSMKFIISNPYVPKLIEKYPKDRKEIIDRVNNIFPKDVANILLNYALIISDIMYVFQTVMLNRYAIRCTENEMYR